MTFTDSAVALELTSRSEQAISCRISDLYHSFKKELDHAKEATIEVQSSSDQWKRDNGAFIPHPATWLNQGRWMDEPATVGKPRIGPSYKEVLDVCNTKTTDAAQAASWASGFIAHWDKRKWAKDGVLIDWQVELSGQIARWRKSTD